ncbi:NUDIX hydrolase [Aeromicrobium sp.]|nr:NUDIX hydrolase [Candidatus Saccharibacteria bacterium]
MLQLQITVDDDLANRKTLPGHVTGAAFVLSPDRKKLLLIHHKILQQWFQPGGHWDPGESDPLAAARREAIEETAVEIAKYMPIDPINPLVPIDIDTHYIPANSSKYELEHYHHDCRYVFVAGSERLAAQTTEVDAAAWFDLNSPECQSLGVIMDKMRELGSIGI